jgi:hypothetical protein
MTVKVEKGADGSLHLVADVDGVTYSFGSIPAARVQHHAERVGNLQERADTGDEGAREALEGVPGYAPAKSQSKAKGGTE